MGADFCMAKFPRFNFSDDRKEQFRQALGVMKEDDREYLLDCYYFDDESQDEIVNDMLETIEEASSLCSRETNEWTEYDENGNDIAFTYTGGMTWGDAPTDAFNVLSKAAQLESVYNLAMKFSAEDKA
tara:strand:- start:1115 stop:1498 length:384 start_codon:yes stop_codon:yes gene_type:complete